MTEFLSGYSVTIRLLLTIVTAFAAAAAFTVLLLPVLRRMKAGQNIREDGPESHQSKSGTPSMGGIALIAGTIVSYIAFSGVSAEGAVLLLTFAAFGALGFFDDYVKVRMKRNLGLTVMQKIALQTAIAALAAAYRFFTSPDASELFIPFMDEKLDIGVFYIPFAAFLIVAAVNSVNLTDGLDGLASGVTAVVAIFFAAAASVQANNLLPWNLQTGEITPGSAFCAALAGGCLGFLIFNRNPAKIFMGDTGSLALGGGLAAASMSLGMELMFPIVGLVYVLEALSDIIQVVSYKTRGKRVFKMAPLHHHFELSGWSEQTVVFVFWGFTAVMCAAGLLIYIR
ncbi:MAG: phospho-N-acetylmuramoyl-pentapeptide-transferase [Clostridiales Family XIII bacterium]|jgi:phospho-N-acetylmuramoyl-pentapeptide-transferase|nr:phospho-N-acetylmuramoyl-pentapeptide-transferase [Clostridiales Family XIII bacterium]